MTDKCHGLCLECSQAVVTVLGRAYHPWQQNAGYLNLQNNTLAVCTGWDFPSKEKHLITLCSLVKWHQRICDGSACWLDCNFSFPFMLYMRIAKARCGNKHPVCGEVGIALMVHLGQRALQKKYHGWIPKLLTKNLTNSTENEDYGQFGRMLGSFRPLQ